MARHDVGNPKFYIDYLSDANIKGQVKGVGNPDISEGSHMRHAEGYLPHLIGLNPTNYKTIPLTFDASGTLGKIRVEFGPSLSIVRETENNNPKLFFGYLAHNLESMGVGSGWLTAYSFDGGDAGTIDHTTYDNVQNSGATHNGWSLMQFSPNEFSSPLLSVLDFTLAYWPDSGEEDKNIILGNVCFGEVFQMPHSPELRLSMTREYDGVKTQTTKGGSTLTQISYDGPSSWARMAAWEISGGFPNEDSPWVHGPSRGRRIWELEYSYLPSHKAYNASSSTASLFPVNEMENSSNASDTETTNQGGTTVADDGKIIHGYHDYYFETDGDFDWNGGFTMSESTFLTSVLNRTAGGAIPFIFQPNGDDYTPQGFALCTIDQRSIKFTQVAYGVYSVKLKIREVW